MFWEEFIKKGKELYVRASYKKDKCAVMAHTGGTTGKPKTVMLSNDNMNAVAHSYYYIGIPLERQQSYFNEHIGYDDIAITCEAIKESAYVFLGNPRSLYKDPAGLLLYFNGVIFVELKSKADRKVSVQRSLELLHKGGNLLIFPEGTWNITESVPVMPIFSGAVNMALETGAEIVLIAIEQYDKEFYLSIGENIRFDGESGEKLTENLRDALCTCKWNIFEYMGIQKREEIPID